MDGIAAARRRHPGRERDHPAAARPRCVRGRRHRRSAPRGLRRRGHARARPLRRRAGRAARRRRPLPARALDRRGHQRHRAAPARRPPPARRSTSPRPRPPAPPRSPCAARRSSRSCPPATRCAPPAQSSPPGELLDTNSLMLAAQARAVGCEAVTLPIEPDDQDRIAAAIRGAIGACDLMIVIAGSSAGRDDYTAQLVERLGDPRRPRRRRPARAPGRPRRHRRHAGDRRPRLPRLGVADLRHLRRPAPGRARGRRGDPAAPDRGPGWRARSSR